MEELRKFGCRSKDYRKLYNKDYYQRRKQIKREDEDNPHPYYKPYKFGYIYKLNYNNTEYLCNSLKEAGEITGKSIDILSAIITKRVRYKTTETKQLQNIKIEKFSRKDNKDLILQKIELEKIKFENQKEEEPKIDIYEILFNEKDLK